MAIGAFLMNVLSLGEVNNPLVYGPGTDVRPTIQQAMETPLGAHPTAAQIASAYAAEGVTPPTVTVVGSASVDTVNAVVIAATVNDATTQERVFRRWLAAAIATTVDDPLSPNHPQRLAFSGAIIQGFLSKSLLVEIVLADPANIALVLGYPTTPGGNLMDTDIDFAITQFMPGLSISRSW